MYIVPFTTTSLLVAQAWIRAYEYAALVSAPVQGRAN